MPSDRAKPRAGRWRDEAINGFEVLTQGISCKARVGPQGEFLLKQA
jgi:hypothetical protein